MELTDQNLFKLIFSSIFGILLGAILVITFIYSLVWVYKDAKTRGKNPWLATIVVALISWPISLLLWFLIRPNKKH